MILKSIKHTLVFRLFISCIILTGMLTAVYAQTQNDKMGWWRESRFGMFIHWGAYAQLHGWWNGQQVAESGAEWIMLRANISKSDYESNAAALFNPTQFNAKEWVSIAKNAGQKYIVITSKHHDGFSMYDTKVNNFHPYDIKDFTPWKKDPFDSLEAECKKQGVRFCVYYSIMDWHHPEQSDYGNTIANKSQYVTEMKAQLKELIERYDPGVLWFDGHWKSWWTSEDGKELHDYLSGLKPDIIVNNRIGKKLPGEGDFGTPEQEIPPTGLDSDWESCMTMNDTWGYRDYDNNWKSPETLICNLVDCASKGGNYLLNVGPTQSGIIPQPSIDRLLVMGTWLNTYGESIYGTRASIFSEIFPWGKSTTKTGKVFLHIIDWPQNNTVTVPRLANTISKVTMMNDSTNSLPYEFNDSLMTITLNTQLQDQYVSVVAIDVNGDPEIINPIYNNTDTILTYSDAWTLSSDRGYGDYRDDVHYTRNNGEYFEVTFSGIGIDYITEKNTDVGEVDIYIDGTLVTTVNCMNGSRLVQQRVFSTKALPNSAHTFKAVKKSGDYMLVDAMQIRRHSDVTPVKVPGTGNAGLHRPCYLQKNVYRLSHDTKVLFHLMDPIESTTIAIYTSRGCLIRELPAGMNVSTAFAWNMHDAAGNSVPAGVYYYRISGKQSMAGTVILMK